MAGALEVLFDVQLPRPERLHGFTLRRLKGGLDLAVLLHEPHPLPTPAGGGLEQHRVAEPAGLGARLDVVRYGPGTARHDRHAGGLHAAPRLGLVAHGPDGGGGGTDEGQSCLCYGLGERGALGQEAVAGMDGLALGRPRRLDELSDVEVRLGGRRGADRDGDVGGPDVGREPVRVGIHRHRLEPFLVAGSDHPQGDFPAVRDEDAFERRHQTSDIRWLR